MKIDPNSKAARKTRESLVRYAKSRPKGPLSTTTRGMPRPTGKPAGPIKVVDVGRPGPTGKPARPTRKPAKPTGKPAGPGKPTSKPTGARPRLMARRRK